MALCLYAVANGDIQAFGDGDVSASTLLILVALVGAAALGLLFGVTERWDADWDADDVKFRQGPWAARTRQHLLHVTTALLNLPQTGSRRVPSSA